MKKIITSSEAETEKFGAELAKNLKPGDILALTGPLGGGKTCFVRGICSGLGITNDVASPTYAILNIYQDGDVKVYHLDVYRLKSGEDLYDIGFEDIISGDGICVIEWADRVRNVLPPSTRWIEFEHLGDNTRGITVS